MPRRTVGLLEEGTGPGQEHDVSAEPDRGEHRVYEDQQRHAAVGGQPGRGPCREQTCVEHGDLGVEDVADQAGPPWVAARRGEGRRRCLEAPATILEQRLEAEEDQVGGGQAGANTVYAVADAARTAARPATASTPRPSALP